jgi:hypothetical protein
MEMLAYADRVRFLLGEANTMPLCASQLAVLEEAVRLADAHQDIRLGFEARRPLMAVARNLLRGDILTAAFTWCLFQYDREPERFAGQDLLTEYRMVIGQLANLCDVPRGKLEELLGDFGRRLERASFSRRQVYFTQIQIAPDLGDRDLALAAMAEMRKYPRDGRSPDPLWESAEEVQALVFAGEVELALRRARPFLEDRYHYRDKSDDVCALLLLPLLELGRAAEATALRTRCLRSYRPNRYYYWWFGELLKFAALTDDLGRATHMYAECQRAINRWTDPLTRLHFALDAVVVFDRLVLTGKQEVSLRLSELVPVPQKGGRYSVAELREWLGYEAAELADRFDVRNGNGYFREQLELRTELGRRTTYSVDSI